MAFPGIIERNFISMDFPDDFQSEGNALCSLSQRSRYEIAIDKSSHERIDATNRPYIATSLSINSILRTIKREILDKDRGTESLVSLRPKQRAARPARFFIEHRRHVSL